MNKEILDKKLDEAEIKQTRQKVSPIRFKEEAINKVKKQNYDVGNKKDLFIPRDMIKGAA